MAMFDTYIHPGLERGRRGQDVLRPAAAGDVALRRVVGEALTSSRLFPLTATTHHHPRAHYCMLGIVVVIHTHLLSVSRRVQDNNGTCCMT